ncbi:hypothetical protein H9655_17935 [Cytobacillus sp. Sa5YUA1]|uniref:Uncharacterized protein n=1 Tax=Cytobacillus stercorigallinarum TaxID=2762240 RepID=A0ABR8QTR2_9BACI|nr:hypothetical protein [Cytobacillus stercorigallinarum]MBD7938919.1 hypothetical protein [Cytobacillus stercorigallinarum]
MNAQPQEQQVVTYVEKREITIRSVLNIYGVFAILGFLLGIFTTPLSLNEQLQFVYHTDYLLKGEKLISLLLFLSVSALIYFPVLNMLYKQLNKREETSV